MRSSRERNWDCVSVLSVPKASPRMTEVVVMYDGRSCCGVVA